MQHIGGTCDNWQVGVGEWGGGNSAMKKLIIIILFCAAAVAVYFHLPDKGPIKVQTKRIGRGEIVDSFRTMGRVEAVRDAEIRARETMRIEKKLVEEGDSVKIGDQLFDIDFTEREDDVKKARLKVEEADVRVQEMRDKLKASSRTWSDPNELETNLKARETAFRQAEIEKRAAERELRIARDLYKAGAESMLSVQAKEDRFKESEVGLEQAVRELDDAGQRFSK